MFYNTILYQYIDPYAICMHIFLDYVNMFLISFLSYDVASWSEITPCNKIDKPLVVYRFLGNVMTSIKNGAYIMT